MRANRVTKHFTNLAVAAGLAILGSPAVYAGPGDATGTLYGTYNVVDMFGDPVSNDLVTIDIDDGSHLSSHDTTFALQALAVDPDDGVIFAGSSDGDVYTVDPLSGFATFLGASGAGVGATGITGMDFDENGVLFAVLDLVDDLLLFGDDGDTLATIDTSTGAATVVGVLVPDGFQAIAFHSDGTLYGVSVDALGISTLYTIDPADGSVMLVGDVADFLDGAISGLQFDCDDTLYAGTALDPLLGFSGGALGTVGPLGEPTPPVYTPIGGPGAGDVAALAFADTCAPPPPTTTEVVVNLDLNPGMPIRCTQTNRELATAVLSTVDFDATTIDADTVRFGRDESATLASEKHQFKGHATRHEQDVNLDGMLDMVFHFRLGDTDFSCADLGGASSALIPGTISGMAGGEEFEGSGVFEMRK